MHPSPLSTQGPRNGGALFLSASPSPYSVLRSRPSSASQQPLLPSCGVSPQPAASNSPAAITAASSLSARHSELVAALEAAWAQLKYTEDDKRRSLGGTWTPVFGPAKGMQPSSTAIAHLERTLSMLHEELVSATIDVSQQQGSTTLQDGSNGRGDAAIVSARQRTLLPPVGSQPIAGSNSATASSMEAIKTVGAKKPPLTKIHPASVYSVTGRGFYNPSSATTTASVTSAVALPPELGVKTGIHVYMAAGRGPSAVQTGASPQVANHHAPSSRNAEPLPHVSPTRQLEFDTSQVGHTNFDGAVKTTDKPGRLTTGSSTAAAVLDGEEATVTGASPMLSASAVRTRGALGHIHHHAAICVQQCSRAFVSALVTFAQWKQLQRGMIERLEGDRRDVALNAALLERQRMYLTHCKRLIALEERGTDARGGGGGNRCLRSVPGKPRSGERCSTMPPPSAIAPATLDDDEDDDGSGLVDAATTGSGDDPKYESPIRGYLSSHPSPAMSLLLQEVYAGQYRLDGEERESYDALRTRMQRQVRVLRSTTPLQHVEREARRQLNEDERKGHLELYIVERDRRSILKRAEHDVILALCGGMQGDEEAARVRLVGAFEDASRLAALEHAAVADALRLRREWHDHIACDTLSVLVEGSQRIHVVAAATLELVQLRDTVIRQTLDNVVAVPEALGRVGLQENEASGRRSLSDAAFVSTTLVGDVLWNAIAEKQRDDASRTLQRNLRVAAARRQRQREYDARHPSPVSPRSPEKSTIGGVSYSVSPSQPNTIELVAGEKERHVAATIVQRQGRKHVAKNRMLHAQSVVTAERAGPAKQIEMIFAAHRILRCMNQFHNRKRNERGQSEARPRMLEAAQIAADRRRAMALAKERLARLAEDQEWKAELDREAQIEAAAATPGKR